MECLRHLSPRLLAFLGQWAKKFPFLRKLVKLDFCRSILRVFDKNTNTKFQL